MKVISLILFTILLLGCNIEQNNLNNEINSKEKKGKLNINKQKLIIKID
jgi:hypothetical protein